MAHIGLGKSWAQIRQLFEVREFGREARSTSLRRGLWTDTLISFGYLFAALRSAAVAAYHNEPRRAS